MTGLLRRLALTRAKMERIYTALIPNIKTSLEIDAIYEAWVRVHKPGGERQKAISCRENG